MISPINIKFQGFQFAGNQWHHRVYMHIIALISQCCSILCFFLPNFCATLSMPLLSTLSIGWIPETGNKHTFIVDTLLTSTSLEAFAHYNWNCIKSSFLSYTLQPVFDNCNNFSTVL